MKISFFIFPFLVLQLFCVPLIASNLSYQNKSDSVSIHQKQQRITTRINVFGVGLGIETKLLNRMTFYVEGGSGFRGEANSNGAYMEFYPYVLIQPRFYINLYSREEMEYNVKYFSATYISPVFMYLPWDKDEESYVIGANVGLQFMWKNNIFYGGELGGGLQTFTIKNTQDLYPIIKLKAGIVF